MEATAPLPFLRETLIFLTLAGILIPLLQRFRINQVIGFLTAGILVGPFGVGSLRAEWPAVAYVTIPRHEGVHALAELGVIFLMFIIGLELSLARVWAMRRWVFGTGTAQVLLCAAAIGLLAHAFGNSVKASVVLGLVLSLSSTAVVMQLLSHSGTLATPLGQASFAILMLQDIAVVPLLIVVDLLAAPSADGMAAQVASTALRSIGVVALILIVGRKVVPPMFRLFARQRQPDVFVAVTLLVALSIAGATALAGLSMALGALLAGLLLAETEYRHEVEVTIEPFKGLLMGLFFMSVGMGINVREVFNDPVWIASSVIGLLLIKSVITSVLLRLGGLGWGAAVEGGTLLAQGGEFAFIVIGSAVGMGLLREQGGQFMLLVVSLSLLLTPMYARLGQMAGKWLTAKVGDGHQPRRGLQVLPDVSGHVVVVGFGRVGQVLGQIFEQQGVAYTAVENDIRHVGLLRGQGVPVFFGNATRPDLLRKLRMDQAACLVVTTDEPAAAMRIVRNARREFPHLPIFARSHDEQHAAQLRAVGASMVVPETLEAGLLLTTFALGSLGLPDSQVATLVSSERDRRFIYETPPATSSRPPPA